MFFLDQNQILITKEELEKLLKTEYDRGFLDAKTKKAVPQKDFSLENALFRTGGCDVDQ